MKKPPIPGYDHAFMDDGAIDMHGLAVIREDMVIKEVMPIRLTPTTASARSVVIG